MKKTFLVCCLSITLFQSTFALEIGGINSHPAHPDPKVEHSDAWFIYTLNPGESRQDEFVIENKNDRTVKILTYAADPAKSGDGNFALQQRSEEAKDLGKWITLPQTEITLQPHEQKVIPFTLTVPKDPSPAFGEHAGGILFEEGDQKPADIGGGVKATLRSGIRVYVTIPAQSNSTNLQVYLTVLIVAGILVIFILLYFFKNKKFLHKT